MTKSIITMVLAGLVAALTGCEPANEDDFREQIVLQGFMVIGQPLEVRLTKTVDIREVFVQEGHGVPGARVRVFAQGDTFLLEELPADPRGSGYYRVADSTARAAAGAAYRIHIEAGEHVLDAETVGAGTSAITYVSADTVEYGGEYLLMRWTPDPLARGYALLIENLEPDWSAEYREVSGNNGPTPVPWTIWLAYPQEDSVRVGWVFLGYTGRHRVRLLTCDANMWNYAWTYVPGMSENYPVSNVRGGLGIFAVGDADTTYFVLTDSVSNGPGEL